LIEVTGWREAIRAGGFRALFMVLLECDSAAKVDEVLGFAAGCTDLRSAAARWRGLTALDVARPVRSEEALRADSWSMYAASRVRDVLLLAHQPEPDESGDTQDQDEWLHRRSPGFPAISVDRFVELFGIFGARPVANTTFFPALHEIVECRPASTDDGAIEVVEQLWPPLMIDDLVFCRGGVVVAAGPDVARPGVADRSTLHFEYWRRHRRTNDLSMGWGHNSQWRTEFRRDFVTTRSTVYNFDGRVDPESAAPDHEASEIAPLTRAERIEFTMNRSMLRRTASDDVWGFHWRIDANGIATERRVT
jgi:hypothetical protein